MDDNVRRALDKKPYVAFSKELSELNPNENFSDDKKFEGNILLSEENSTTAKETPTGSETNEVSDDDINYPEGSLFKYRVPGILSREEVETRCDLDHWKLVIQGTLVDMEVESSSISEELHEADP